MGVVWLLLNGFGEEPVRAQEHPWTAWLYNPNGSGTMNYLTDLGTILQQATLPILEGQQYPPQVAVSRNGQLIAYMSSNPILNADRLVVYHPATGEIRSDFIETDVLQHSIALYSDPQIFNQDDTALAFSIARRAGGWRIIILDVNSGFIGAELFHDHGSVTALNIPGDLGSIPVIRQYAGAEVAFVMMRTDNPDAIFGSYIWNVETGEVRENTLYPGFDNDIFPATGEIITPIFADNLPHNNAAFNGEQRNALQVYLPADERIVPFYGDPNLTIGAPHFIQNGELILAQVRDAAGSAVWRVLDRTGTVIADAPLNAQTIIGMADGFLYQTGGAEPALLYVNTRDGLDTGIQMGQGNVQLAWAKAVTPDGFPLPPITAWVNLSDEVALALATQNAAEVVVNIDTAPTEPPAPQPPAASPTPDFFVAPTPVFLPTRSTFNTQLEVGMRAVVVPDGHAKGLRTDPADDAPAIILLYTDMVVNVLEGPNITGGNIWWLVQTRDNDIGWAIEGANGETWLAPRIETGN
jgi:hypothetical protein